MSKLLHAGLWRLKRDKLFWFGNLFMILFCGFVCVIQYRNMRIYETQFFLDYFIFGSAMIIGIILSIVLSLWIGTEYSDGTVRNKIIMGHGRSEIYLSNFLLGAAVAVTGVLLSVFSTAVIGTPMFGFLRTEPSHVLLILFDYLLAAIAYGSVYQMVSMLFQNKAYAAIINVLLAFAFLFVGIGLYQSLSAPEMIEQAQLSVNGEITYETVKNPYYLSGLKREIYQFFLDFLPGGQAMQIVQCHMEHPYRLPVFSLVIIGLTNAVGISFFRKKDIK